MTQVTQEQALEALNRMRGNASMGISSNDYEIMNPEGYAMDMDTHFEDVETLRQYIEGHEWQPIESAPRDGELFMLRRVYPEITEYWSCWFCPAEKTLDGEIEGEAWILNDDEKQLIVGEEDHGYEWKPIEPPQEKS